MVERHLEPVGEVREVEIIGKKFKLDASLHKELEEKVKKILSKNMHAFAWSTVDMLDIDFDFLYHCLTMDEGVMPGVQRHKKINEKKLLAMKKETHKLVEVNHIREIQYPEWLENVVMVKKSNEKWTSPTSITPIRKILILCLI